MARTPETQVINGHRWEVTPWPGMYGLKMQARLAPLLSGVVVPLLESIGSAKAGGDPMDALMGMDVEKLVGTVLEHIDETQTPDLIMSMLHGTFIEGKDATNDRVFNDHFQANYLELYKGLAFVVRANMGDVFGGAAPTGIPEGAAE